MKTDFELQNDVLKAINWQPLLKQVSIGVKTQDGIVTLTGVVDSFLKKTQAENTAKKVAGVKAVVEKIAVKFMSSNEKSDNNIAADVLNALKWNGDVPVNKLQVKVEEGHVTLEGELQWNHQREAAQKSVSNVPGIKVLTNLISIKPVNADEVEKGDIEQALLRNWALNNQKITVEVSENDVILTGIVHSYYQLDEAERVAWKAPGVRNVNNKLFIDTGK